MSSKISDLTSAIAMGNTDLLTIVQGGTNLKIVRTLVLKASPGESMQLQNENGLGFLIDNAGANQISYHAGSGFSLNNDALLSNINVDALGQIVIQTNLTQLIIQDNSGSQINFNGGGGLSIQAGAGVNPYFAYNAVVPASWSGSAPPDVITALERMLAVLVGLHGGPIP